MYRIANTKVLILAYSTFIWIQFPFSVSLKEYPFFFLYKKVQITVSSQKETEKGKEAGKSRWLKGNVEGAFPGFKGFFICLPSWFSFFVSFFFFELRDGKEFLQKKVWKSYSSYFASLSSCSNNIDSVLVLLCPNWV